MFPNINFDDVNYLAFEPESGYADPVATANSYAAKAQELGAEIRLRNPVEKLIFEKGKVSGLVLKDGSQIACDKVILCTNVWTNRALGAKWSGGSESSSDPACASPRCGL